MNSTTDPVVSSTTVEIRVPTYRRPGWLARALSSIQAQTWSDWRAMVIDDANLPETRAQIEAMGDRRIAYTSNPENLGVTKALSKAFRPEPFFEEARFACVLEDDNWWEPDFLSSNLDRIRQTGVDICTSEAAYLLGADPNQLRDVDWFIMRQFGVDQSGVVPYPKRLKSAILGCGFPNSTYFWRLHCGVDLSVPQVSVNQFVQERLRAVLLDRPCDFCPVPKSRATACQEGHSTHGSAGPPLRHRLFRLEKMVATRWLLRELRLHGIRSRDVLAHPAIAHKREQVVYDFAESWNFPAPMMIVTRPGTWLPLVKGYALYIAWRLGLHRPREVVPIRQLLTLSSKNWDGSAGSGPVTSTRTTARTPKAESPASHDQ